MWPQFVASSKPLIDPNDVLYSADITIDEQTRPWWRKGIIIGSTRTGVVTDFIPDPDQAPSLEIIVLDRSGTPFGVLTFGRVIRTFAPTLPKNVRHHPLWVTRVLPSARHRSNRLLRPLRSPSLTGLSLGTIG
jgi:hypothetical protein